MHLIDQNDQADLLKDVSQKLAYKNILSLFFIQQFSFLLRKYQIKMISNARICFYINLFYAHLGVSKWYKQDVIFTRTFPLKIVYIKQNLCLNILRQSNLINLVYFCFQQYHVTLSECILITGTSKKLKK